MTIIHGINRRVLKGDALREANDMKEGFFKLWKLKLSPRKEFVENLILVYYPFYLIPYQVKWGKTPFVPGMLIDARFREFSVLAGVPARSRIDTTNELIIQATVDQHSAKRFAETKLRDAMKRKRAKEIMKKSKEVSSYEVEELELIFWPFWVIKMEDMWNNYRFIAVDAILNFRGYNLSYSRFFSGPLFSMIDRKFEEIFPSPREDSQSG